MNWQPEEKDRKGRPGRCWSDNLKQNMEEYGLREAEARIMFNEKRYYI